MLLESFFGLQDMLRFDKASKTVDCLLKQSKESIRELIDCKVVSGIDEYSVPETASTKTVSSSTHSKSKIIRRVIKTIFYPFAKESRNKARERARARTNDKKKQKQQQQLDDQQLTKL
ncbi:hypothetical protein AgCh_027388 [Apium graveolens]